MPDIKTVSLTKKYKDLTAVDDLDLTVEAGQLYALLGVNGAGKTTAIKMMSCLTPPTGGDAFLCGHSVKSDALVVKSLISVSPQETAVAPNLSVKENLRLICGVHGFTREKTDEKVQQLMQQFDLAQISSKRAAKLSGGWQRKLSLAMALISEPKILFLDEPTLGLDVIARTELWDVIRSLKGKVTIVLTTHYLEEAEKLSDMIGIMRRGKLVAQGTADELKRAASKESFEDAFIELVKEEKE